MAEGEHIPGDNAASVTTAPPIEEEFTSYLTLNEMPAHFAHFYETDRFLIAELSAFITDGFQAGENVVVVATQAHQEELDRQLQAHGVDIPAKRECGQYICLDAAATLAKFMVDGLPDPQRFTQVVGSIIERATAGRKGVRVFGEMVALLWVEEQYDAALRLEELWNDLRRQHSFALFCAYPMTGYEDDNVIQLIGDVCAQHSHVIPAESYSALNSKDARARAIVQLQQQAILLQPEIAQRKAAEERLQATEDRYRRLFEAYTDGILIVNRGAGTIVDANPCIQDVLGRTREELLGRKLWETGLFEDNDSLRQVCQELDATHPRHHEHRSIHRGDGQNRDIEFVSSLYEAGGEQVIQCTLRDITTRKQAEDVLRTMKGELEVQVEDLRRLHEMSVNLTSTLDVDSVLNEVLQAAISMQGTDRGMLSLRDPQGDGLVLKASCGLDEDFIKAVARVPVGWGACGMCYQQRRRIVVEDVFTDPLVESYRTVARQDGFYAVHSTPLITRSGNIIGVISALFTQLHRPSEREMRLMDLYARMAADFIENAQLHRQVRQELKEREHLLEREQQARAEAERANRMKDEFLATVSHELRTPLTPIIGWSQQLRRGVRDEATRIRGLEIIEHSARAQMQLIEDILDVSRIITGKLSLNIGPVDMATVINAAMDSVQLAADSKGIQLAIILNPAARHISGDANRLQQVIWNLISNAIKFTPAGGSIDVRLERVDSHAQIMVRDTGEGIEPDFLPFIFDRFRQADSTSTRSHNGLGLGLAIVRHLVELHGGTVVAESAGKGCGTTFTIRLPLAQAHQSAKTPRRSGRIVLDEPVMTDPRPDSLLDDVQVLLVDDDHDTLKILAMTLADCGATVKVATSVAEALELLQSFRPHVLVSDLAMPGEDGYSLIKKVRADARDGQIPAVAFTAYAGKEDRRRALAAGYNLFVPKPVEPNELILIIANLAELHHEA